MRTQTLSWVSNYTKRSTLYSIHINGTIYNNFKSHLDYTVAVSSWC